MASPAFNPTTPLTRSSLPPEEIIFGYSPQMLSMRERIEKLAAANVPVLLEGESGIGKDVLARYIHLRSPWSSGPFVKVNCPAVPGTLIESELFGYERGAFTGANTTKPGRVEMAHRGTLFLDEISELDFNLQSKLLQLLQDGQFSRIGSQQDKTVDVRVICATNKLLKDEVAAGAFRQDLYYRINVVRIHLPSLRDRAVDIPPLAKYFLDHYNMKYNCRAKPLSQSCLEQMQFYAWPGNIRQLENLIRRYVIIDAEEAILPELVNVGNSGKLPFEIPAVGPVSLKKITRKAAEDVERKMIFAMLQVTNWNRKRAARNLGISYRALLYKLRAFGVAVAE
jgi:two-component system, NtrC family, response regulator AtoC